MISRGIHRNRCLRQVNQLRMPPGIGRMALSKPSSKKAQAYAVVVRITTLVQALQADGDALASAYQEFRCSGHRYGGAPRIGRVIQAGIPFNNSWQHHKQPLQQLMAGQCRAGIPGSGR